MFSPLPALVLHIDHSEWLGIPLYAIFFGLAGGIAIVLAWVIVRRISVFAHPRYFDVIWLTWFGGMWGAKVVSIVAAKEALPTSFSLSQWWQVLEGGYQLMGGVIVGGGLLGFWAWLWRDKICFWTAMQLVLLIAPAAFAVGRMGCIFGGCCSGYPMQEGTRGIFLAYSKDSFGILASSVRLAVPIYDILGMVVIGMIMWGMFWYTRRQAPALRTVGSSLALFFLMFGALRVWEEGVRDPALRFGEITLGGWYFSHWVAWCLMGIGATVGCAWMSARGAVRDTTKICKKD